MPGWVSHQADEPRLFGFDVVRTHWLQDWELVSANRTLAVGSPGEVQVGGSPDHVGAGGHQESPIPLVVSLRHPQGRRPMEWVGRDRGSCGQREPVSEVAGWYFEANFEGAIVGGQQARDR